MCVHILENTHTRPYTRSPSPSLTSTDTHPKSHPNTVTTAYCNAGVLLLQQVLSIAQSDAPSFCFKIGFCSAQALYTWILQPQYYTAWFITRCLWFSHFIIKLHFSQPRILACANQSLHVSSPVIEQYGRFTSTINTRILASCACQRPNAPRADRYTIWMGSTCKLLMLVLCSEL